MYYHLFELNHAAVSPLRAAADAMRLYLRNPLNPFSHTPAGKNVAAACEVFERVTRRYGKPEWGIASTLVGGTRVAVEPRTIWSRPFCNLVHFERQQSGGGRRRDPRILIVAPMSGHYATLLRGTVEALLPRHEVYITDWVDARMVPIAEGRFDLDDYIDYLISMLHFLGPDVHILGVCQPAVPVFAAVALMEEANDPFAPRSMTLMGGPIDTRISPTEVNNLAGERGLEWFRRNVITAVPWPHPGFMRLVYPGFLQLSGFMSMNLDRHVVAHREFYQHLIRGDGDSATKHREFYDEYLSVMDLTAEFYLQTVDTVFIRHALPKGEMTHRGRRVNPAAIRRTAMLTVEGEKDDISGLGQTEAAHRLTVNLAADRRHHYMQPGVGHYGVFNGSRFRSEIAPRISDFVTTFDREPPSVPAPKPATRRAKTEAAGEPGAAVNGASGSASIAPDTTPPEDAAGAAAERLPDAVAAGVAAATQPVVEALGIAAAAADAVAAATRREAEPEPSAAAAEPEPAPADPGPAKSIDDTPPKNAAGEKPDPLATGSETAEAGTETRRAATPIEAEAGGADASTAEAAAPTLASIALAAAEGEGDDLTRINGVGPKLAEKLNALGVFHLRQISAMTEAVARELDAALGARGRVLRDDWAGQARRLSAH